MPNARRYNAMSDLPVGTGLTALVALLLPVAVTFAAPPPPAASVTPMTPDVVASYDEIRPQADYTRRVVMIPMRDGVKLYTVIVMKKGLARGPSCSRALPMTPKNRPHARRASRLPKSCR